MNLWTNLTNSLQKNQLKKAIDAQLKTDDLPWNRSFEYVYVLSL